MTGGVLIRRRWSLYLTFRVNEGNEIVCRYNVIELIQLIDSRLHLSRVNRSPSFPPLLLPSLTLRQKISKSNIRSANWIEKIGIATLFASRFREDRSFGQIKIASTILTLRTGYDIRTRCRRWILIFVRTLNIHWPLGGVCTATRFSLIFYLYRDLARASPFRLRIFRINKATILHLVASARNIP